MSLGISEILDRAISSNTISQKEAEIISSFLFERQSQKGTRESGMVTRCRSLIKSAEFLHGIGSSLVDCSTEDVLNVISKVRGNGFSKNYQKDLIGAFKRFLLWRIDNGADLNEKKIRQISVPSMDWKTKCPEDMLTKDEINIILDSCTNTRDRALIAMLYDASARPVDLRTLTWGNVIFDEFGARFQTNEKTGVERWIRLTFSVPYLSSWKQDYPLPITNDAPVFISLRKYKSGGDTYVPLEKWALERLVRTLRQKTGIEKIKPSIFRPSKITHDIEDGYDTSYILLKNWGHLNSGMLSVYAKPKQDFIDRVALEKAGMQTPIKQKERSRVLNPKQCVHCTTINPPAARYCSTCGHPMGGDVAADQKVVIDNIEQDPLYKALEEKMKEEFLKLKNSQQKT